MSEFVLNDHPHRRFNPLKNQWILVSPHRAKRPWQGQQEEIVQDEKPSYDPSCYLCPGNKRITGEQNPNYTKPFVFKNDFSALLPDTPAPIPNDDPLFQISHTQGESRVICFSPDHSKTLPQLSIEEITDVVTVWQEQANELKEHYQWVQIFENKGSMMGVLTLTHTGKFGQVIFYLMKLRLKTNAKRNILLNMARHCCLTTHNVN